MADIYDVRQIGRVPGILDKIRNPRLPGITSIIPDLRPTRQSGYLFNDEYGLFLKFQLNPDEISRVVGSSYESISPTGWHAPIHTWTKGDSKTISFNLFFHKSGSSSDFLSKQVPGRGVLGIIALLESFQYPGVPIKYASIDTVARARERTLLTPPPKVTFKFGSRLWTGHMNPLSIKESVFDKNLTPRQVEVGVTIVVDETTEVFEEQQGTRRAYALATGATSNPSTKVIDRDVASDVSAALSSYFKSVIKSYG